MSLILNTITDDTIIEQSTGKRIKNFIYNLKDEIGKGFSSTVYKGYNELSEEEIAVKVIELGKIKNEVQKYLLNNEMRVLRKMVHKNVLKCLDILMTKNNVYIVTEFCKKGDLLSIVKRNGRIPEHQALRWMKDIVEGYLCIEENKILHRDIKTANIFVSNDDVAKIADFGFSEFIGEAKPSIPYNVGSPAYMSPQSYQQSMYSSQSDLWSIGIILFQMLVGQVPFKKHQYGELIRNLTAGNLGIPQGIQVSEGVRRILVGCFRQKLNQRLTPRKLYELVIQQLSLTNRSIIQPPKPIDTNAGQFRRSIVGVGNNRSSTILNEIVRTSQINQDMSSKNSILQGISSYINQLFRFGRLLHQNKMPVAKSLIHNIFHILNKHRLDLIAEGDAVINHCDPDLRKDYDLIKNRILELQQFSQKRQPIDPNLRLLIHVPFRAEPSLAGYLNYLKFSLKQFDKLLDSEPNQLQNLGCIFDYLLQYIELLQFQTTTNNIVSIASTGKLLLNMKDRPVTISQTHVKLLKYKRKILGI